MPEKPPDKACPKCSKPVPPWNDHCYSCGYDYPGPDLPDPIDAADPDVLEDKPIVVYSYPGRTQADAAGLFAKHANNLAARGYHSTGQSWAEGRPGVGRVIALGLFANSIRPKGYLTVTYQRIAPAPTASALDLLARLGELRDAGVLTEDEFQAKKAELLLRL